MKTTKYTLEVEVTTNEHNAITNVRVVTTKEDDTEHVANVPVDMFDSLITTVHEDPLGGSVSLIYNVYGGNDE